MSAPRTVADLLADPAFPELKAHVVRTTGLAYITGRDADVAQRLLRRLEARDCRSCGEYLRHLRAPDSDAEQEALVHELTIGETYFFRFPEQFDALREWVIPELLERNRESRRLRIWSAGCATGPEPYSLAILLREEFGAALGGWDVEILGTDLNRSFLRQAAAGRYSEWALRTLPAAQRAMHFTYAAGEWTLRDAYREWVRFQPHNLVEHAFPPLSSGPVDLILCRNVMIYFDQETIRRVIRQFAAALADGGWLVSGHAEMIPDIGRSLQAAQAGQVVFYRKAGAEPPVVPLAAARPGFTPVPSSPGAGREPALSSSTAPARTQKAFPPPPAAEQPASLSALRALADRGDWRAAVECGRQLIHAEPLNADAQFYLALVLETAGECAAAEQSLRRAVYLQRSHALAHYHLGLLLAGRKGVGAGRKALENALQAVIHLPDDAPLAGGELTAGELRRAVDAQLRVEARR